MKTLIRANLKSHAARLVAASVAVMLSVGFIVTALTLYASLMGATELQVAAPLAKSDLIVEFSQFNDKPTKDEVTGTMQSTPDYAAAQRFVNDVIHLPGVVAHYNDLTSSYSLRGDPKRQRVDLSLANLPPEALRTQQLVQGSWPSKAEIAITEGVAQDQSIKVGDKVTIHNASGLGEGIEPQVVTVSGIIKETRTAFAAGAGVISTDLTVDPMAAQYSAYSSVQLKIDGNVDTTRNRISELAKKYGVKVGPLEKADIDFSQVTVYTKGDKLAQKMGEMTGQSSIFLSIGLFFGFISCFVAALVISNVFSVIVAQRVRELALLRSIGAQRRNIRSLLRTETYFIGLVGGLGGILLGVGIAYVAVAISQQFQQIPLIYVLPPWYGVVAGLAVGIFTCLIAGMRPLKFASNISPLVVMRSSDAEVLGTPSRPKQAIVVASLLAVGIVGMWLGVMPPASLKDASTTRAIAALLGGAVIFVAALVGSRLFIPQITQRIGQTLARSPGAKIAAQVAIRNPRRITSTAGAILIGVTLVVMCLVSAASSKASFLAELDSDVPVDVTFTQTHLDQTFAARTAANDVFAAHVQLRGIQIAAGFNPESTTIAQPITRESIGMSPTATAAQFERERLWQQSTMSMTLVGATPQDMDAVIRSSNKPQLRDDIVYVSSATRDYYHVMNLDREPNRLTFFDRNLKQFTLRYEVADVPYFTAVVSPATLRKIAPNAPITAIWLRLRDDVDFRRMDKAAQEIGTGGGSETAGSTPTSVEPFVDGAPNTLQGSPRGFERNMYVVLFTGILLVVLALLATSLVISIVGVSNTMSLSVMERRRELSLLRAVGMKRGQVRTMIVTEAMLISSVAGILGSVLGTVFGVLAVASVLPSTGTVQLKIDIPWWQILAAVAVMMLASVFAGLAPARRASHTSPVRGVSDFA